MPLRFNMLLADAGIDPPDVRLLRHQTRKVSGKTPYSLWRDNCAAFEQYQSTQKSTKRAWFNGQYWASFISPPQGGTLFVGLYRVNRSGSVPEGTIDPFTNEVVGGPNKEAPYDQYEYTLMEELSAYRGRLFIEWGASERVWVQKADNQDKEIIMLTEILQEDVFPGFIKFSRSLSEIETMPSTWKAILSATKGVYLLVCPDTGKHYVGSAYGDGGFLGRWQDYVRNNHGGNAKLKGRSWSNYFVNVLEVAASSASDKDIIDLEHLWMDKLRSRSFGLNS